VGGTSREPRNANHEDLTVNVRDFGAQGDSVSDDAGPINAAIAHLRKLHSEIGAFDFSCRLIFPTGMYLLNSGLDLSNVRGLNTIIDGQGSVLIGNCAGEPVVDALGSRWLTIRDLVIVGMGNAVPSVGLQIGVTTTRTVAGSHRIDNVKIVGSFLLASLYNRGAEVCEFDHLFAWNNHAGGFGLVQDGMNYFGVISKFIHSDLMKGQELSFNENLFINSDFRHGAAGTPVWLGDTARHQFIRCYSATQGGPSFQLHCGTNSHTMLEIDCHCETQSLRNVFTISSVQREATIHGFSYRDHQPFVAESIMACDQNVSMVHINNGRFDIGKFRNHNALMFGESSKWRMSGIVSAASATGWNGQDIFTGIGFFGSLVEQFGVLQTQVPVGTAEVLFGSSQSPKPGYLFFDRKTNKLLVWAGREWVDAMGTNYLP
jgi:hypothetical protein